MCAKVARPNRRHSALETRLPLCAFVTTAWSAWTTPCTTRSRQTTAIPWSRRSTRTVRGLKQQQKCSLACCAIRW
ncbi:hypothetical protein PF011_g24841 [Phytophthora fragariae]|uniref:Uncharacterized protein n=1 Tax=Phytophthora fragariae TaxID=53985 RepID=A0A6A3HV72_9STRA|nr:hypothetical protein PF011_g24841 [Phytophthora fragariae]